MAPNQTTPSSRASYTPWGEATWSGTSPLLGFQSQVTDPATGAVFTPARSSLPALARFSSPDPLWGDPAEPLSLNRYLYAQDDPITLSDPTGLKGRTGGTTSHCGRPCEERMLGEAEQRYAAAVEAVEEATQGFVEGSWYQVIGPDQGSRLLLSRKDAGGEPLPLGDYAGTSPLAAAGNILTRGVAEPAADASQLLGRCARYLEACIHNIEIAISPLVTLGASVVAIAGGVTACALGGPAGCVAAALGPLPAGMAGLWATYLHMREVWWGPNRDRIYQALGPHG